MQGVGCLDSVSLSFVFSFVLVFVFVNRCWPYNQGGNGRFCHVDGILHRTTFVCSRLCCILASSKVQGTGMRLHFLWFSYLCLTSLSLFEVLSLIFMSYLCISNGWVPKCGLKFAVDYVAYRQGPPFYHSRCDDVLSTPFVVPISIFGRSDSLAFSFSVLVKNAWEDTEEPWQVSTRPLTWQYINSLSRMSNQARAAPFSYLYYVFFCTDGFYV